MADNARRGTQDIYSGANPYNALQFVIESAANKIATAIPVKVMAVNAGGSGAATGYVDVLPLVTFVGGDGESIQPVTLYHLPYSRVQGGIAAIVIDPVVGDIGLAVFAHSDSSTVTQGTAEPQQPGSKRHHSMSDGFYIGGFLNQSPSCYLELMQDNTAVLNATGGVTINGNTTINGNATINGDVTVNGNFSVVGGNSTMTGSLTTQGDVVSGGISVQSHTHGSVQPGSGSTGQPQ